MVIEGWGLSLPVFVYSPSRLGDQAPVPGGLLGFKWQGWNEENPACCFRSECPMPLCPQRTNLAIVGDPPPIFLLKEGVAEESLSAF